MSANRSKDRSGLCCFSFPFGQQRALSAALAISFPVL